MANTLINWVISALILWLLSFIPFLDIAFSGWVAILVVAVVLGLINALIVPVVKNFFKKSTYTLLIIISLVIDAAALWLAGVLVPGFSIGFFPTAIIAAIILTALNAGFSRRA